MFSLKFRSSIHSDGGRGITHSLSFPVSLGSPANRAVVQVDIIKPQLTNRSETLARAFGQRERKLEL